LHTYWNETCEKEFQIILAIVAGWLSGLASVRLFVCLHRKSGNISLFSHPTAAAVAAACLSNRKGNPQARASQNNDELLVEFVGNASHESYK